MDNFNLFKNQYTINQRLTESNRVINKFPDRIPILCQRSLKDTNNLPYIDKHKYLVPKNLTIGQVLYVIRKRLKLSSEKALFIFVHDHIPSTTQMVLDIYNKHKDIDGFLYLYYSCENVFG